MCPGEKKRVPWSGGFHTSFVIHAVGWVGLIRVSRIFLRNLRYGREMPKFARNLPIRLRNLPRHAAIFMPHIQITAVRPVRYWSVAKFQTPARPPIIRHPLPFRLLPSHDACFISPNPKHALRRAQETVCVGRRRVWPDCALLLRRARGLGICVCCEQAANFAKIARNLRGSCAKERNEICANMKRNSGEPQSPLCVLTTQLRAPPKNI